MQSDIAVLGLGTMGSALARNLATHGFRVSLWNRSHEKVTEFVATHGEEHFYAPKNFEDFIESIERPRKIIAMVPAGKATEEVLQQLKLVLEPGDMVMDGGNAHFSDTERLQGELAERHIHLLGVGISGGEEGALKGASIMPGGNEDTWRAFEPFLSAIAAEDFHGRACAAYMGSGGAGHYVKMVHNGIEYAEMQALAEAYDILKTLYNLPEDEIADIFAKWEGGRLESFLNDISVDILRKKEEGKPLLQLISDEAAQKGTGSWTTQEALKLGTPAPGITGAVFVRDLSKDVKERAALSKRYPVKRSAPNILLSDMVRHLENALYATRFSNFEQGLSILRDADKAYEFELNFPEIIRIWQGGCIIRAKVLEEIHEIVSKKPCCSLYCAEEVHDALLEAEKSWRLIVAVGVQHSIPMTVFSSGLFHFESYRRERMPTNFIQGLRDRFGSHGYERVDQEGHFHTDWT